jgi:hypothetical protein
MSNPVAGNQFFSGTRNNASQIPALEAGIANIAGNLTVNGAITPGTYTEKSINIAASTASLSATNGITTLAAADSGSTYLLNQNASGFHQAIVLPPAVVGLTYNFVVVDATPGSTISIQPFGYTFSGGNVAGGTGDSEAYAFGIQSVISVGSVTGGYSTGAISEQVNSVVGTGTVAGGIMFTNGMGGSASLRLTCVSTSVTGAVLTGLRWVGTGQVTAPQDIDVSA